MLIGEKSCGAGGMPFEDRGATVVARISPGKGHQTDASDTWAHWHGALPMTAAACRRRWVLAHKSIRASPRRATEVVARAAARHIVRPASEPLVWALTDQIAAGSYICGGNQHL